MINVFLRGSFDANGGPFTKSYDGGEKVVTETDNSGNRTLQVLSGEPNDTPLAEFAWTEVVGWERVIDPAV